MDFHAGEGGSAATAETPQGTGRTQRKRHTVQRKASTSKRHRDTSEDKDTKKLRDVLQALQTARVVSRDAGEGGSSAAGTAGDINSSRSRDRTQDVSRAPGLSTLLAAIVNTCEDICTQVGQTRVSWSVTVLAAAEPECTMPCLFHMRTSPLRSHAPAQ
jgi:hypothetical protein